MTAAQYADWNSFCLKSDDAWFWHTTHWLEYALEYKPGLQSRSECFLCLKQGHIVAICPLITENHPASDSVRREFSYAADAVPAPAFAPGLSAKSRKAVADAVFAHIDQLAANLDVARASFRISPLAPSFWSRSFPHANPLLKFGFNDISQATQILDLAQDEQCLLRDMRKGHRADIARASRLLRATVFDQTNITKDSFNRYRLLHQKAAGRVTRPLQTFELMYQWICSGHAILCAAALEGNEVGFALVCIYKDGAYYSSSCEDPDCQHLPIGHLMQWKAMQWLKANGTRRYEIGIQQFASQVHSPATEKNLRIAFFKRGFGGETVADWRGEKFYNRQHCLQILQERAAAYASNAVGATERGVPA